MGVELETRQGNEAVMPGTAAMARILSPREAIQAVAELVDRHEIAVTGTRQARLTLPAGLAPLDFLADAQRVAATISPYATVVEPAQLESWKRDPSFFRKAAVDTVIEVQCMVTESGSLSRAEQLSLLQGRGQEMPTLAELAMAHTALLIASELSKNPFHDELRPYTVRGRDGQIFSSSAGLTERTYFTKDSEAHPALRCGALVRREA